MTQNFPVKFFKNLCLTTEVILFTRHCGKYCSIGHQKFGEGKPANRNFWLNEKRPSHTRLLMHLISWNFRLTDFRISKIKQFLDFLILFSWKFVALTHAR